MPAINSYRSPSNSSGSLHERVTKTCHSLVPTPDLRQNQSFVLGSNPMARMGTRNGSSLGNPEVEFRLLIARDVAVTPYGGPVRCGSSFWKTFMFARLIRASSAGAQ
jgi:hypothetical protein